MNSYPCAERTDYFPDIANHGIIHGEPFNETNFHAINLVEVAPHNMDALNTMLSDYIIDKDNQEHNEQVRWKALIFFDEWQGGEPKIIMTQVHSSARTRCNHWTQDIRG